MKRPRYDVDGFLWRGHVFRHAFTIIPSTDREGSVSAHERWKSHQQATDGKMPHPYGRGPFTDFEVPSTVSRAQGVCAFLLGTRVMYVGQSGRRNLRKRLHDYHRIGGRQSFAKGPRTTCYINARIYEHACIGDQIRVHTLDTADFDAIEMEMIHEIGHPPWNLGKCKICGHKNEARSTARETTKP